MTTKLSRALNELADTVSEGNCKCRGDARVSLTGCGFALVLVKTFDDIVRQRSGSDPLLVRRRAPDDALAS